MRLISKIDAERFLVDGKCFVKKIPVFKAAQIHDEFVLHDENQKIVGKRGDFLICAPSGDLGIVDKEEFLTAYEEINF